MLIGVGFAGNALKLQMHRRNFQPACKGADDLILFFLRAQHKVDGLNFKDFDIPPVGRLNNAVLQIFDRNEILSKAQFFRLSFSCFSFCGAVFGHIYIPPFSNAVFFCAPDSR